MACTRKRGSLVGRWLLAHLATLLPSSPSQGMFLRSEYLGSARTLSFPRTAVESCYMDTYARRHDPHTTNAVRARATIHNHVHAGQITTDTDIGRVELTRKKHATHDYYQLSMITTNEDILRFVSFLLPRGKLREIDFNGSVNTGVVYTDRAQPPEGLDSRIVSRVEINGARQVCVLRGVGETMRYTERVKSRVCAHTSALEGERWVACTRTRRTSRERRSLGGFGTRGARTLWRRNYRVQGWWEWGREGGWERGLAGRWQSRGRRSNAVRSSLGVGTPWRRGLGSKARSVREHARAKCVRNATRGRESSARLLPHRFLQPRSPPRPTRDSPHFYTHTRQNRVESKKKGESLVRIFVQFRHRPGTASWQFFFA